MCIAEARWLAAAGIAALLAACAATAPQPRLVNGPMLGRPVDAAAIAAADVSVFPDGRGLPPGAGGVSEGLAVYERACRRCHGSQGVGGSGGHLVGRGPLTGPSADRTIGSYWPYATTLFDYVRRAMPPEAPWSLRNDEAYAVTAYLLQLNGIVPQDAVLDAGSLARIRMPNQGGFVGIDAPFQGPRR